MKHVKRDKRRSSTKKGVDESKQISNIASVMVKKKRLLADQCPLNQKNRMKAQKDLSREECYSCGETVHYMS